MRIPTNWPWTIPALFLLLPWLALAALGGFWLWQNQHLETGLFALASFSGAAWLLAQRLKRRQRPPFDLPKVEPDARWSPTAEEAWAKVEQLAEALDPPLIR
jgi:hypothetical protein